MLNEQQIRDAFHASRVIPVPVPDRHGPLGLEHLAEVVARTTGPSASSAERVERPLTSLLGTWAKLEILARRATTVGSRRRAASEVAAGLIEQAVGATKS